MRAFIRVIVFVCVALLIVDGGALVAQRPSSTGPVPATGPGATTSAPTTSTVPGPTAPPTTTGIASPVPSTFALEANLLIPNDLGGYYTPLPAESAMQLAASGCLAPLGHPAGVARNAVTYLRGPFSGSLPVINEQLNAFSSVSAAAEAFRALRTTIQACHAPTVAISGSSASVLLAPVSVPALGDESAVAQGPYHLAGRDGQVTVAVVRSGPSIVVFLYADAVPASNRILGDVISTLRAAVGKAAPVS